MFFNIMFVYEHAQKMTVHINRTVNAATPRSAREYVTNREFPPWNRAELYRLAKA